MEYEVKLSKDRVTAELVLNIQEVDIPCSVNDLMNILKEEKVLYGIKIDVLEQIAKDPKSVDYPVKVAAGVPKTDGIDSYLQNEIQNTSLPDQKIFNFRSVMHIPSVKQGQLLATMVPAFEGTPGKDVTGQLIPAKPGRPLKIKAGNNVLFESGKFYSMLDGQVSITNKSISVNPVFEVKGDLDLRTGNIDFVGNIIIRGNVPSGYELKAGGDIWVYGLVEAATLNAEGNIIIQGGVAGAMKGSITAGGNVQVNYLNQAIVKAGQDVNVKSSILHSKVTVGGNVDCKAGTIIGGIISAGRNIFVKDLGNELFTKTELAIGWNPLLEKTEIELIESIENSKGNIKKLTEIEGKLAGLSKHTGKLTDEQQQMISKQRATRMSFESSLLQMMDELKILQAEKQDRLNSSLFVVDKVYPNTKVYFGKYALLTNQIYRKVMFRLENSEISIHSYEVPEKVHT